VKLLNLGCGTVFNSAWVNVDIVSSSPEVKVCDLRKKLPYSDAEFDACYCSHVIEHLKQEEANLLLAESWRILKPKGIIRLVVPDLEAIVREYLKALEQVEAGVKEAELDYDWMMLELYDQVVRSFRGGQMAFYLDNPNIPNKDFVISRVGYEVENYEASKLVKTSLWKRLKTKNPIWIIQTLRNTVAKYLVAIVTGSEASQALEEGLFRNSGEIHRWMYDRFSLRRLLEQAGFIDIRVCRAEESRIPDFNSYNLDIVDGKVRKPDSLFMEAIKP
jgi:predicted SAM-dependent methyltransferase